MSGYFDDFGRELVSAGHRDQRRPVRRLTASPARSAAVAVAATALLLLLLVGLSRALPSTREVAGGPPGAPQGRPAPKATPPVAADPSPRKRWRLTATACRNGGLRLTLEAPRRSTRSSCQRPRPASVNERYVPALRQTFVYGVTSKRVDAVEVKVPQGVRVRTRPAPLSPRSRTDLRVYVARLPGRRSARAVVPYEGNDPIRSVPASPSADGNGPRAGAGGSQAPRRRGSGTSPRSRPQVPAGRPAPVVLLARRTAGGTWRLAAEQCAGKGRSDRVAFAPFAGSRPPTGELCASTRFRRGQPPYVSAFARYLPAAGVTVVAGYAHRDATRVYVGFSDGTTVEVPVERPSVSVRPRLPRGLLFYTAAASGRHEFRGAIAWGKQALGCARRCIRTPDRP
jgi:hypothetical protein